jgi:dGTP triphosphohydrolase
LYSKGYARYVDKTQALSFFNNAHISRRSLHVQWVSRISRQIGRGLNLNLDLIEAIALGHDLGHTPYGHVGENALNKKLQEVKFGYFAHNANSVRNLLYIERLGRGYNISLQVLDGILSHNGEMLTKKYEPDINKNIDQFWYEYSSCWSEENFSRKIKPMTLEGCVVRVSDIIAYVGKDCEDAIDVNIIKSEDIPSSVTKVLGNTNTSIINALIGDIVTNSYQKPHLSFSNEVYQALKDLLSFITKRIHSHPVLLQQDIKLQRLVSEMYDTCLINLKNKDVNSEVYQYYLSMSKDYQQNALELITSDYISGLTDNYLLDQYEKTFLPIQYGRVL